MPQFEILYYPGFEPSKYWLRSYLLFWDKVNTIIPTDVDFEFSKEVMEIVDLDPDGLGILAPKEEDIVLNESSIKRLDRAFKVLKERMTENGFVARIEMRSCGCDEVVSFSCDEKENRLPHPQLARV